ncbi:MAG: DUF362 domain-containing protein [bacterium]
MQTSNRRSFLRVVSSVGLAVSAGITAVHAGTGRSRIVVARRPGKLLVDGQANREQVADLLGEGISALLDEKDRVAAWKKLFAPNDIVGVKVNTLGGKGISPKPELVTAVCDALQAAGVPPQQIIVWDRFSRELQRAGYEIVTSGTLPRCYGTDSLRDGGYDPSPQISGTIGSCFSQIISAKCTAMINLGVLKDHDLSGISVGMKNLFGLIHNPNRYHFDVHKDPYLPDLLAHPYVRQKSRLVIIDAMVGQYSGGPAYKPECTWPFEGILMGTDVVAIDRIGCTIIEERRKEAGLQSLTEIDREPTYIDIAEEKGLGCSDRSRIDVVEVS